METNESSEKIHIVNMDDSKSIPLSEYVAALEKAEKKKRDLLKRQELIKETFGTISQTKRSIYIRPKNRSPVITNDMHSPVKTFSVSDQIKYLAERFDPDTIALLSDLPTFKRKQIERTLLFYRQLKKRKSFLANVVAEFPKQGYQSINRNLLLLEQVGLVRRFYVQGKLAFEKLPMESESHVVGMLIKNSQNMIGYRKNVEIETEQPVKKPKKNTVSIIPTSVNKPQPKPVNVQPPKFRFIDEFEQAFAEFKATHPNGTLEEFSAIFIAERK